MGEVNKLYQDLNGKPWAELAGGAAERPRRIECDDRM